jgi:hypothetical protein
MHLVGMNTLLILLSLGPGYHIPGARISQGVCGAAQGHRRGHAGVTTGEGYGEGARSGATGRARGAADSRLEGG